MQPAATATAAQRQIASVITAAWRTLGHARDLPGDIEALAAALHDQGCDCGGEPDEDTVIRASGLVQAGWRLSGDAQLRLSELLDAIAKAWKSASTQPHSTAEDLRWSAVCVLAHRTAEGMSR
jgi:hypothetical protein